MEHLLQLLSNLIGDQDNVRLVFVGLVATAFFVTGLAMVFLVASASDPLRRRLRHIAGDKPTSNSSREGFLKLLGSASPYVLPKKEWERSRVSAKLVHAGYRAPNALGVFYGTKVLFGMLFPVMTLLVATRFPQLTTLHVVSFALASSFIGLMMPNFFLERRLQKRRRLLSNGFPDALDMLVVCVEAGLGLAPAIQRVTDELAISHPELSDELGIVNAEIRAGIDRVAALKNLAHRTGLEDIRGLVTLLAQSLRFGTSVADTLRVYAEDFRDKRMQRAEEKAALIGTKLIFPLIFCMFPAFFLVAIGPAVLGVLAAFSGH